MKIKLVKELMLPLSDYAVVSMEASLKEALKALELAQKRLSPDRQPHRAVLVTDKAGKIVGKLGHLGFLKALEPKYNVLGDVERLSRSGLSLEFINSMMDNYRFWQDDFAVLCRRSRNIKIKDVMKPVEESIDENATLTEAIHRIVMWQTLSILVTSGKQVVGILRLSDLFEEVVNIIESDECAG
jgi:CBS domain-containing protein